MTKFKWYFSLRLQLIFALTILVLSVVGMGRYTLVQLDLHMQDTSILYRISEMNALKKYVAGLAYMLDGKLNTAERNRMQHELAQAEVDMTRMLAELRAGKIVNAFFVNKNQSIKLDAEELEKLTAFENKWQSFLRDIRPLIDAAPVSKNQSSTQFLIQKNSSIHGEFAKYMHQRFDQEMHKIRVTMYKLLALVLLISLGIFVWLFFRLFRPLKHLSTQIKKVEHGQLDVRLAWPGKDEMGQLSEMLQQTLQRLHTMNRLIAAVECAKTREGMLAAIVQHLQSMIPVEWAGVIRLSSGGKAWVVGDSISCGIEAGIASGMLYTLDIEQKFAARQLLSPQLFSTASSKQILGEELAEHLTKVGVQSLLLLPMDANSVTPVKTLILLANRKSYALPTTDIDLFHSFNVILQSAFLRTEQLQAMMLVAVSGLARLAESRDPETGDHLLRMGRYSTIIAEELNRHSPYQGMLSAWIASILVWLAPLHDIGKVGIADAILLKPGKLTANERQEMQKHAMIGGEVLRDCHQQVAEFNIDIFMVAADIAEGHHEKFDGSGYPNAIQATEIPLVARIVAVADVFDALTSKRPYKEGWSISEALAWIREQSGSHFDPVIVEAFERALPRIIEVYDKYRHV